MFGDEYDCDAMNWLEARCMSGYEADGQQCFTHDEEEE